MTEEAPPAPTNILTLYSTNLIDIPAKLRDLADGIEKGDQGEVNSCAIVTFGSKLEVFGYGEDSGPGMIVAILQAGALRIIKALEEGNSVRRGT